MHRDEPQRGLNPEQGHGTYRRLCLMHAPSIEGRVRGESLVPLYEGAASLVNTQPDLYDLLTLVDALRVGRARERRLAKELLEARLREGSVP